MRLARLRRCGQVAALALITTGFARADAPSVAHPSTVMSLPTAVLPPVASVAPAAAPQTLAAAPSIASWRPLIDAASARFAIPANWIAEVMQAESGGLTMLGGRPITSPKGAMGLMQLMPATWAEMRRRHGLGSDPYDPEDNILAGAAYLRLLYERFGFPGLFGAYNAGPERYAAWAGGRRGLPAETRAYLARLAPASVDTRPEGGDHRSARQLLFAIGGDVEPARPAPSSPAVDGLFAIAPGRPQAPDAGD